MPTSSTNSFKKKKPWFNDECKEAIKKRKDSLKHFKQYPTKTNLNACKILRAKARRIIKQAKRSSWKDFISKINTRTPMTTIWNMIKKINGKNQSIKYSHIKVNDKIYESKEIANILGRTFKSNSSSVNYNPQFKRHKQETEMEDLTSKLILMKTTTYLLQYQNSKILLKMLMILLQVQTKYTTNF